MNILITGGTGLVGSHFVDTIISSPDTNILTPTREELEITDKKSVADYFEKIQPEIVLHFAAFTDVSKAEEQRDDRDGSCWVINVEGTTNLAEMAAKNNAYFIHISTDVVFSGSKQKPGPYSETDLTEENSNLLSWYGWTKKIAEDVVKKISAENAILRISNPVRAVYPEKLDYVRKILKSFDNGTLYPMFNDQYLSLTYINEVTDTIRILIQERLGGIFHVSSTNIFTPFKLAELLIKKARDKEGIVKPISIEEFLKDNPSRYPQFGGLKVNQTEEKLKIKFRTWEEVIDILAKQLSA